ncbi:hypothetical protein RF11_10633 [Thelohanellus kitauei]|uniref:Uncharacterized protein n=1 Tax=Thelohanellus kitauei TaxID=669202 RepID=A0A0C2IUK9_THEKT|nr:hypothetical protein RF11_10633 [Thelohanellus kitauei]
MDTKGNSEEIYSEENARKGVQDSDNPTLNGETVFILHFEPDQSIAEISREQVEILINVSQTVCSDQKKIDVFPTQRLPPVTYFMLLWWLSDNIQSDLDGPCSWGRRPL